MILKEEIAWIEEELSLLPGEVSYEQAHRLDRVFEVFRYDVKEKSFASLKDAFAYAKGKPGYTIGSVTGSGWIGAMWDSEGRKMIFRSHGGGHGEWLPGEEVDETLFAPPEHHELHTDISGYDESKKRG